MGDALPTKTIEAIFSLESRESGLAALILASAEEVLVGEVKLLNGTACNTDRNLAQFREQFSGLR